MLRMPSCLLFIAALICFSAIAEDAPPLQALPSADGIVSWWLVSPVQKEALDTAVPPKDARIGGPVGAKPETGVWKLNVSAARFMDFRPLNGGQGTVWAACRIKSNGGARRLRAGTYGAMRVFVDGKEVLKKAQPLQPYADEAEAEIELPKGECEIAVGVNIRYGYAGFQFNLTEGKGGLPKSVPGDSILIAAAPGKAPDVLAAALDSITFIAKDTFVNPGQKTVVMVAALASAPAGIEQISGYFLKADGTVGSAPMPPRSPLDFFGRNAWQVEFVVPPTDDMRHALMLEVTSAGKILGKKKLEVYSLKGIAKTATTLAADIAAREKASGKRFPHAALAAEKLLLFMSKIDAGEERVSPELGQKLTTLLDDAKRFANFEENGNDPLEGKRGYLERAYVSPIDNGVQPYFTMVPSALGFEPEGLNVKYPLVVFLHGYVPSYDKHRWWEEIPEFNETFERNNAFMALPFGRSNTDFQSCGEVDVLDVIADMRKRYPIDPDRIYLYGYSMGGMAVYHIAGHNPDLFAGAIVIAGRADSPLQNKKALTRYHEYKQWLIHADNPISLCENFLNIPLRIYHGNKDFIIDISEAKRMEKRLKEVGATVQLFEVPGDHFFGFDLITTDEPLKWLLDQRKKPQLEKRWMKQYSLRHAAQGGVRVTAAGNTLEPLEAVWTVGADGKPAFSQKSASISQLVIQQGPGEPVLPTALRKTPQRCGPVREAICNPFVIAYGTSGSPEANEKNKANAEKFAQEWFGFTRSRVFAKADKDVTDEEKKTRNLFLFGEQQENALHAAAADKLPIQIKDGNVAIGAKTTTLKDRGAIFTYPSPFAPADGTQVIVVYAGLLYGEHIGLNHKFDLLPDFLVYGPHADRDGTGTNRFFCAGFFDGEWKLNDKTTWWEE